MLSNPSIKVMVLISAYGKGIKVKSIKMNLFSLSFEYTDCSEQPFVRSCKQTKVNTPCLIYGIASHKRLKIYATTDNGIWTVQMKGKTENWAIAIVPLGFFKCIKEHFEMAWWWVCQSECTAHTTLECKWFYRFQWK